MHSTLSRKLRRFLPTEIGRLEHTLSFDIRLLGSSGRDLANNRCSISAPGLDVITHRCIPGIRLYSQGKVILG